jgi:formamidopyrimidine-DNA glycosylase
VGRRIERVEVGRERSVRRTSREELTERLTGHRAIDARRRGKYLLFALDSGDELMIHLRMSGQVLLASPELPRPPHCHVVLTLGQSDRIDIEPQHPSELRFVDPRTFGEVIAFDPRRRPPVLPELDLLGIDPIVDSFSADDVRRIVSGTKRPLKAVLLDQHLIAGVGNIYADEILHRARLYPFRSASSLDERSATRLFDAIVSVLGDAVESGGSTLRDARYVDVSGSGGSYQDRHRVYGRAGEPCLSCLRGRISTARLAGRATCWCPRCQPADRRGS